MKNSLLSVLSSLLIIMLLTSCGLGKSKIFIPVSLRNSPLDPDERLEKYQGR